MSTYLRRFEEVPIEEIRKKAIELKARGILDVILSGGEPTVRRDLPEVVALLTGIGLTVSLVTNGTLLTEGYSRRLRTSGLRKATLSLDGPDAIEHDGYRGMMGAFDRLLRGIRNLKKAGIEITINVSLHDRIIERIPDIFALIAELRVDKVSFVFPMKCGRVMFNQFLFERTEATKSLIIERVMELAEQVGDKLEVLVLNPQCGTATCPSGRAIFGIDERLEITGCPFEKKLGALSIAPPDSVGRQDR